METLQTIIANVNLIRWRTDSQLSSQSTRVIWSNFLTRVSLYNLCGRARMTGKVRYGLAVSPAGPDGRPGRQGRTSGSTFFAPRRPALTCGPPSGLTSAAVRRWHRWAGCCSSRDGFWRTRARVSVFADSSFSDNRYCRVHVHCSDGLMVTGQSLVRWSCTLGSIRGVLHVGFPVPISLAKQWLNILGLVKEHTKHRKLSEAGCLCNSFSSRKVLW